MGTNGWVQIGESMDIQKVDEETENRRISGVIPLEK
jgi:hypothetical protein